MARSDRTTKIEDLVNQLTGVVEDYPSTPYTRSSLINLRIALSALKLSAEVDKIEEVEE